MDTEKKLTFGEKAVGVSFNPSGDVSVQKLKELYASIIDILNEFRNNEEVASSPNMLSGEHKRLASVAITEAQGAQMWAVKAITWKD